MTRTLTDEDCERIAQKFLEALSRRLAMPPPAAPAEAPLASTAAEFSPPTLPRPFKMAYTGKEVEDMLGISTTTLWRLRITGRIGPVEGVRRVIFSRDEVTRFLRSSSSPSVAARTSASGVNARRKSLRGP